jgi:hypothetical protein
MSQRDTSKQWFQEFDMPSESQFSQLLDYLRFKDESLEITEVNGLQDALNGIAGNNLKTLVSNGSVEISGGAGRCLEYIIIHVVNPITLKIGTTPGGDEISQIEIDNSQPIVVNRYFQTAGTVYLEGIENGTTIKYKII